jgi:hypothetical protein
MSSLNDLPIIFKLHMINKRVHTNFLDVTPFNQVQVQRRSWWTCLFYLHGTSNDLEWARKTACLYLPAIWFCTSQFSCAFWLTQKLSNPTMFELFWSHAHNHSNLPLLKSAVRSGVIYNSLGTWLVIVLHTHTTEKVIVVVIYFICQPRDHSQI